MKTKTILFFFFLFFANVLLAQKFVLGATVNYAKSQITYITRNQGNLSEGFTPSFNAGLFFESKINKKMSWGIEAVLVQIENVDESPFVVSSRPSVKGKEGTHTHLSYLGLPIYYKYKFGKFGFKLGPQMMIFLRGSSYSYVYYDQILNTLYRTDFKHLKAFDFGFKYGIDYQLTKKLSLRMDYYHGHSNIFSKPSYYPRKNRQISAGVSFIIGIKKEENY